MSEFFKALEQAERDRLHPGSAGAPPDTLADEPSSDFLAARTAGAGPERPPAPPPPAAPEWTPPRLAARRRKGNVPVLVTRLHPTSIAAEAYRTVRSNLEFSGKERPCRNVAVTSPTPGGGKSTTAANLAVVAAEAGARVCVADADFRRPVLHEVFGLENRDGLTAVLEGRLPFRSAARDSGIDNLSVLVSGQNGSGLAQHLFTTQRLERLFREAAQEFDLIIYDTPPIISVADAVNIAALCDGVILVVRYGSVPSSVVRRAARQITQVNGRVLGVLLNHVDLRSGEDEVYRYYRAYYDEGPKRR